VPGGTDLRRRARQPATFTRHVLLRQCLPSQAISFLRLSRRRCSAQIGGVLRTGSRDLRHDGVGHSGVRSHERHGASDPVASGAAATRNNAEGPRAFFAAGELLQDQSRTGRRSLRLHQRDFAAILWATQSGVGFHRRVAASLLGIQREVRSSAHVRNTFLSEPSFSDLTSAAAPGI
jgi:hypothetical protein